MKLHTLRASGDVHEHPETRLRHVALFAVGLCGHGTGADRGQALHHVFCAGLLRQLPSLFAYEMVNLVPSFQLTEGNTSVRGYAGAIGNVLIDGRPPATKDETLQTILSRINFEAVEADRK